MTEKKTLNFEESMEELIKASELLKSKDLTLEDSIKAYEKGMRHYRDCIEILEKAKQEIKVFEEEQK